MKNLLPVTVQLIADAIERHGTIDISPCCERFRDSVTEYAGYYKLWYNTPDHSSHIVKRPTNGFPWT